METYAECMMLGPGSVCVNRRYLGWVHFEGPVLTPPADTPPERIVYTPPGGSEIVYLPSVI